MADRATAEAKWLTETSRDELIALAKIAGEAGLHEMANQAETQASFADHKEWGDAKDWAEYASRNQTDARLEAEAALWAELTGLAAAKSRRGLQALAQRAAAIGHQTLAEEAAA